MKLTNIGGATAILEHKGKRMLFDPWLDEGIFHGSWYHYPPTKMGMADLGRFDYIYISHIHEDHCSAGTIKHLNKDAEVILIDREPRFVQKFLANHGFQFKKLHLIKPYTPQEIELGMTADMVEADPAHEANHLVDSGLVLRWDDFVLYNANDCPPYADALNYILRTYKKVDLALLPYAGGSSYPPCYSNLSHADKMREKERIFNDGIKMFMDAANVLQARYLMPFADQYVIGGSRAALNAYLPHPPDGGAVEPFVKKSGLKSELLLLNSAQTFNFDSGKKTPDEPFHYHTVAEKQKYIQEHLLDKRYDHEAFQLDFRVSLDRLVKLARARLWNVQKKQDYLPAFYYYLEAPDRKLRFEMPLDKEEPQLVEWNQPLKTPYLKMSSPSTLFALLLLGHVSWNIADAALFIDYERVPNHYDPRLHALANYLMI